MTDLVPAEIRAVLKTYQDTAPKSLHGPGLSIVHPLKKELHSPGATCEPPILPPPLPPPEISQPVLSAADTECGVLQETILEGRPIGCFLLGGELRLCMPQVLNNVLTNFTIEQINPVIEELHIVCSQCTDDQLHEFKKAKILPQDVKSCGLITRTNAERLCSALLHRSEKQRYIKNCIQFKVYHKCFGKCEGTCIPDLYSFNEPACIRCNKCYGMFTPQKFVCHVHKENQETSTCHWGFNSSNWRSYVHVAEDIEGDREDFAKLLDELRDRELNDLKLLTARQQEQYCHKRKLEQEEFYSSQCKTEPIDYHLIKKSKMEDYGFKMLISMPVYPPWYQNYHRHFSYPTATLPYPMEPPVLQNPDRVVKMSECERFQPSFQPNVALAPRRSGTVNRTHQNNLIRDNRDYPHDYSTTSERHDKQRITLNGGMEIKIKQERPSTPLDSAANSPEEADSPPHGEPAGPLPPLPPPTSSSSSLSSQSHSLDGLSGSNEITSSTSPVPVVTKTKSLIDHTKPIILGPDEQKYHPNHHHNIYVQQSQHQQQQQQQHQQQQQQHQQPIALALHQQNTINHQRHPSPRLNLLNGGRIGAIAGGNPEFELSTDTDDDSLAGEPVTSNTTSPIDIVLDAMKESHPVNRDRVIDIVRLLMQENERLRLESDRSRQTSIENQQLQKKIKAQEDQINDLIKENHHQTVLYHTNGIRNGITTCQDTNGINGHHEDVKPVTEPKREKIEIRVPLKKSARRSPEDCGITIMQPPKLRYNRMENGTVDGNKTPSPPVTASIEPIVPQNITS